MPYLSTVNACKSLSTQDKMALLAEFDLLRRELDEIRANVNGALTKLDADATVTDTNYNALNSLSTSGATVTTVTAAAPRRFTRT